jgi:hypothetical protein
VPVSSPSGNCTSPQFFGWSMENTNVTLGTPPGCTNNATTSVTLTGATIASDASTVEDGTYAIKLIQNSTGTIPITYGGTGEEGTFDVWIYWTGDTGQNYQIVELKYDANNWIAIKYTNSSEKFYLGYTGTSTYISITSATTITTPAAMHHVVAKWSRSKSGGTYTLSLQVDAETPVTSTAALNAMAGVPTTLTLYGTATYNVTYYADLLKVYNTWQ